MGFPEADYVTDELKLALNTDSQIPINHIIWLNDYKFYGEESYVYQDKNKLHELYKDGALCIHDKSILDEASNWCIDNGYAGAFLAASYDMDVAGAKALKPLTAMNAILASSTAMNAILASSTAMNAIAASSTAMNAILASSTAMNAIAASSTAMNAIAASSTAMNAILASSTAMNAILASSTAMNAIAKQYKNTEGLFIMLKTINSSQDYIIKLYDTLTSAPSLFENKQVGSYDGVAQANSIATVGAAPNAFLACACGYYSGGATENIYYDGKELVNSRGENGRVQSVTKSNVNAFTMAPSTFTENGDGYLAVQKFTAI
ncbi:hypothetical protein [Anaerotignum faecicola]